MSQCVHSGRSTSLLRQPRCDVISISVAVTPSAGSSWTTFHVKLGIGRRDVSIERGLRGLRAGGRRLPRSRHRERERCCQDPQQGKYGQAPS